MSFRLSLCGRLPLMTALLLVPALVTLTSCSRSEDPTAVAPLPEIRSRIPASGAVVTISTANNQILAELPIGAKQGLEPGAFLRVYDATDSHLLKGMLQVTEVLGPERAIARQVTLGDRQNPFTPGDRVREVLDLAGLADPRAIEQAARTAASKADQLDSTEQARFALLREQFQKELVAAKARYDHDLASVRTQYEGQLSASDAAHALDVQRREQELRTDMAALKATFSEQVAAGVASQRQGSNARLTSLDTEKENLSRQVQSLLTQADEQNVRIAALVARLAEKDRDYAAQLRAEVETRELLTAKLSELESRLSGKPTSSLAVLSADLHHGETVLERLTRLSNELASEQDKAKRTEAALITTRGALTNVTEKNTALATQVEALASADNTAVELGKQLTATKEKLTATEQQRAELELARLDAERQLYDLAARVLRLAGSSPETMALQARLRTVLSQDTDEKTKP